ncbi:MAG: pyroglutamyl-peptidase I [Solobacterium sp.]|nr:pyroglutamyl-peptidase I [Solobacterium sp.]
MMKTILVTGFEPFGEDTVNPSWEAVKLLDDEFEGVRIIKKLLPVVMGKASDMVLEVLESERPDAVVSVGLAGGRKAVSIERIGINCDDYRIADNGGNTPQDQKIAADGPDGIFATIPVRKIKEALDAKGIPAEISNTAGTYLCNHVLYKTLYACRQGYPHAVSGFIHVPCTPEMAGSRPSMELSMIKDALEEALRVIIRESA